MGSYFKGWSSLVLPNNAVQSNNTDSIEPFFGQVLDINYAGSPSEIGRIRVKIFRDDIGKDEASISTYAYPADMNMIKYPMPGELVSLTTGLTTFHVSGHVAIKLYYTELIASSLNITYNGNPYFLERKKRDSEEFTQQFEKRFENAMINPESIIENKTINVRKALKPFEGDMILQSRWGSGIRFGSTGFKSKNQWSIKGGLSGNPIMIISANRSSNNGLRVEDVNREDSVVYVCSRQALPLKLSTSRFVKTMHYIVSK